jgi:beta-lactamase superfamily II metal-dependent hydrolase
MNDVAPLTTDAVPPATDMTRAPERVFRIEMLPAYEGDCLLVTWGDATSPHRLLIDGGRKGTHPAAAARLKSLPADQRELELLVVTHVDADHVEGVLEIIRDRTFPVTFKDVWFNGYVHLLDRGLETYGPKQGELLSSMLRKQGRTWNGAFSGRSVEIDHDPGTLVMPGDLRLTILAPDRAKLEALIPEWDKECRKAGLVKGVDGWREVPEGFERYGPIDIAKEGDSTSEMDPSEANGASIVLMAEFAEKRAILAGDAHPDLLATSLRALGHGEPYPVHAFKLPHHGSRFNVSIELIKAVSCARFLVSSNGSLHNHPHSEAMSRVIKHGGQPEIVFNYRSDESLVWERPSWKRTWGYRTRYPDAEHNGTIAVDLLET